jgi:hypothetical protein
VGTVQISIGIRHLNFRPSSFSNKVTFAAGTFARATGAEGTYTAKRFPHLFGYFGLQNLMFVLGT